MLVVVTMLIVLCLLGIHNDNSSSNNIRIIVLLLIPVCMYDVWAYVTTNLSHLVNADVMTALSYITALPLTFTINGISVVIHENILVSKSIVDISLTLLLYFEDDNELPISAVSIIWVQLCPMDSYSLSGRTSYSKISWSHKVARFRFRHFQSLWNVSGTSTTGLQICLWNVRAARSLWHPISRFPDFTKIKGKTSVRLVNWGACLMTILVNKDPIVAKSFKETTLLWYTLHYSNQVQ